MKVLVLSCSTGGGHNSCANYIKEELKQNGIKTVFKDFYDIVNSNAKEFASKLYLSAVGESGEVFKSLYKLGELYSKTKIQSPVYLVNKLHRKKLYDYIEKNHFNLVITTHLFPSLTLTAINKANYPNKVHFITIATDYEPCPFMEESQPDYFVIQKGLENKFIKKGIPKEILLTTGIPVSSSFIKTAKSIRNKLKLKKEDQVILIMLGSMGFGKVNELLEKILLLTNSKVIVVCGSNKKLYNELNQHNNPKLIVLGFVNNINDLIYSSDIVLSKPGGLSSTEIASIGKPLIHVFPIPGIETYNVEFFKKRNMSLKGDTPEEIIKNINKILNSDKLQKEIIHNQHTYINKNSAEDLITFITKNKTDN